MTIQKNGCSAAKVRMRAADYYVNARHISTICPSFPKKSDNIDTHSKMCLVHRDNLGLEFRCSKKSFLENPYSKMFVY